MLLVQSIEGDCPTCYDNMYPVAGTNHVFGRKKLKGYAFLY